MSLSAHANVMTSVGTVLVPLSLMSWLAVVCRVSLCYNLLETWVRLVSQKTVRISCMGRERRRDTRGAWRREQKRRGTRSQFNAPWLCTAARVRRAVQLASKRCAAPSLSTRRNYRKTLKRVEWTQKITQICMKILGNAKSGRATPDDRTVNSSSWLTGMISAFKLRHYYRF